MCRCKICQEYELWCNKNHLRGLWCFETECAGKKGPRAKKGKRSWICMQLSAQAQEQEGWGWGDTAAAAHRWFQCAFLWLMGHVRLRHAGFYFCACREKGLRRSAFSVNPENRLFKEWLLSPLHQSIIGSFQMVAQGHLMRLQGIRLYAPQTSGAVNLEGSWSYSN